MAEGDAFLVSTDKGDRFELEKDEMTVGRSPSNDFHFGFVEISSRHAAFKKGGGVWRLEDSGSTNGTFVNGEKIKDSIALKNGDMIRFGRPEYEFHVEQAEVSVNEEATMMFGVGAEAEGSDKTAMFDSPVMEEAGKDGGADPFAKMSIADFKGGFGKDEAVEDKPEVAGPPPLKAPADTPKKPLSDEKTIMGGVLGAGKLGDATSFATNFGPQGTIGAAPPGSRVFAELEEKTLSRDKMMFQIYSIENKIGKGANCHTIIEEDTIAEEHAMVLFQSDGTIQIKLLDSNAILKINGRAFKNQNLKDGDTVELGDMAFIFRFREAPKFSKKKSKLFKSKKVVVLSGIMILLIGGMFAVKKMLPENNGNGNGNGGEKQIGPKNVDAKTKLLKKLTLMSEIWRMIDLKRYKEAETELEKYKTAEVKTAKMKDPYVAPEEVAQAQKTITILYNSQKLYDAKKFYDAWKKMDEIPAGEAEKLELVKSYRTKFSETLTDIATKAYREGRKNFQRGDYQTAKTDFEKALSVYPDFEDSSEYLQRIKVRMHYKGPIDKVRDLLRKKEITLAYEEIGKIEKVDIVDPSVKAQKDIDDYEERKENLYRHAGIYNLYQSGQGDRALEIFGEIPKDYDRYRELETYVERVKRTLAAYQKAEASGKMADYQAVLKLEDRSGNFYHKESLAKMEGKKKALRLKCDELLKEGVALKEQGKEFEALKKYYEAHIMEPSYKTAKNDCERLGARLVYLTYQLNKELKKERFESFDIIVNNTPADSTPHRDAKDMMNKMR